jgi:hypothetical protein
MIETDDEALDREARLFARYLVGTSPAPEILARYRAARRALWPAPPEPHDAGRLAFLRRHPWCVGSLDAAAALLDPGGQLRGRILLTGAILEATTTHADAFLPRAVPLTTLLWRLTASGLAAAAQVALGAALWVVAGRSRA